MTEGYKPRHDGARWQIVFGAFAGPEATAVTELQRAVQAYFAYIVETVPASGAIRKDGHLILLGTAATNPHIAVLIRDKKIASPTGPQGYSLAGIPSPFAKGCRVVVIAGHDAAGVLYGVTQFCAAVLPAKVQANYPHELRAKFDVLPEFAETGRPAIADRGLWTWGYAIYDYRRYLDAMVRLRMNMLTVWNDAVPVNIAAILDYAHARGIKVIMGFHWGWGLEGVDLSKPADRDRIKAMVVENYTRNYRDLPIDGIYFQTLTEHKDTMINGRSVASLVCALVNETPRAIYAVKPDLHIQFGLHASSIADKYTDLKDLDPRVIITWEDAGLIPFGYIASTDPRHSPLPDVTTAEATIAYSKKLATFRPDTAFGMVPKGWAWLDWSKEFEHHGPFILGERDPRWTAARRAERQNRWDWIDAAWVELHPPAAKYYTELLAVNPHRIVTGLVEDGMIEEGI